MEKILYQLQKSQRKTISITIKSDRTIVVRAPRQMPDYRIEEFVSTKSDWIIKKLYEIEENESQKNINTRKYVNDEKFLYMGREYALSIIYTDETARNKVELATDRLIVYISPNKKLPEKKPQVKELVEAWYKAEAKEQIPIRVKYYEQYMNESVNSIRVKEQKTRWGSCSSKRNVNFNWRLIMAPAEIIDYVVVHELCHLKYMNHSKEFWQYVGQILPDYELRRKWLRDNGNMMWQ